MYKLAAQNKNNWIFPSTVLWRNLHIWILYLSHFASFSRYAGFISYENQCYGWWCQGFHASSVHYSVFTQVQECWTSKSFEFQTNFLNGISMYLKNYMLTSHQQQIEERPNGINSKAKLRFHGTQNSMPGANTPIYLVISATAPLIPRTRKGRGGRMEENVWRKVVCYLNLGVRISLWTQS